MSSWLNTLSASGFSFPTIAGDMNMNGIKTVAIGYDYISDELYSIAANGGMQSPLNLPLVSTDLTGLEDGLSFALSTIFTCRFTVDNPSILQDFDHLNVFVDSSSVPKRSSCIGETTGWSVTDAPAWEMELCGETCDDFKENPSTALMASTYL